MQRMKRHVFVGALAGLTLVLVVIAMAVTGRAQSNAPTSAAPSGGTGDPASGGALPVVIAATVPLPPQTALE